MYVFSSIFMRHIGHAKIASRTRDVMQCPHGTKTTETMVSKQILHSKSRSTSTDFKTARGAFEPRCFRVSICRMKCNIPCLV